MSTTTVTHPRPADTPCPKCGGDRSRRDYTLTDRCHLPAENEPQ